MIGVKQVILTGLISVLSYGQTIHVSGTYLDQKTNPIPEARVRYLLDTTPVDSTTTDMEGHFVLHLDFTGLVTETTPHDFTLSQNYPNPFNPTTQFTVATPTKGQVVIYNILGQLVDRLTLPEAGAYTITWGGANRRGELVPAGVYLYALQTATQRQVHKMVLLDGGDGRRLHIDQQVASRNMNGLARPADPVSQIEFIKDNTTPRTLTIPTPDADTELDIIIGNVGPQVLEDPPLVNLDLNDTLFLNLNAYIYNDDSTQFIAATDGFMVLNDTLLMGTPGENPLTYSVIARDPTDTTLVQSLSGILNGIRTDSLRFIQDIPDLVTNEDEPIVLDLSPYLYNPYGDSVYYSWVHHDHLTGTFEGMIITLIPEANWAGTSPDVIIHALGGTVHTEAESNPFSVRVNPVNDPPRIDLTPLLTSLAEDTTSLPDTLATFTVTEVDSGDWAPFYLLNDAPAAVFARITWNELIVDSLAAEYHGNPNLRLLAFDSHAETTVVAIPFTVLPRADVTLNIRTLMQAGTPIIDDIESTFQIGDSLYTGVGSITRQISPGTYEIWAENDSTGIFWGDTVRFDSYISIRTGNENPLVTPALETRTFQDTSSALTFGTEDITLELYKIMNLSIEDWRLMHAIINGPFGPPGIDKPNTATPVCYIDTSFAGYSQPDSAMVERAQYVINTLLPTISEGRYTPIWIGYGSSLALPPDENGETILRFAFDTTTSPPGFNSTGINADNILYYASVYSHHTWNDLAGLSGEGIQGFQAMQGDPPSGDAQGILIHVVDGLVYPTPFGILITRIRDYFNPGDNL